MRKILLTLCAVLFAVPAFAIEVYNNGDNSVGIYGFVNGYMGYGLSATGETNGSVPVLGSSHEASSLNHNLMYGLQNNSRIGTNIKIGNFTAQFELGANEKTLVNGTSNTVGLQLGQLTLLVTVLNFYLVKQILLLLWAVLFHLFMIQTVA